MEQSTNRILEELFKSGTVRTILKSLSNGRENAENLKDLEQDIYLILMTKNKKLINKLYDNHELNYYIANIAYTQLRSTTSPYYYHYKKFQIDCNSIEEIYKL